MYSHPSAGTDTLEVFVVDSQAGASRPFSPAPLRRGAGKAWRLLWLLVSLLLLGMIVEAFFIYQLYQKPLTSKTLCRGSSCSDPFPLDRNRPGSNPTSCCSTGDRDTYPEPTPTRNRRSALSARRSSRRARGHARMLFPGLKRAPRHRLSAEWPLGDGLPTCSLCRSEAPALRLLGLEAAAGGRALVTQRQRAEHRKKGDSASTSASASALKGIPGIAIDGMLTWREFGDTFIHGMKLKEGGLLVQTEGYYFIYSRVHFSGADCSLFKHVVQRYTPRYNGPLELMKAKHFHCREKEKNGIDTSYLAGTFHLYKNDSIVVKVEKPSQLLYQESSDNFFGAYMI
ncbi:hypothetical protein Z043_113864 [Scleropages formosus]|uniref:THD domain-containing protein n=1 Tax=Scleropages formosus TaxID=113540 RepID=A0A0P7YJD6_SCLFO|nr:hypothetical protein Z043_113864 [Scleropages formosus]